MVEFLIGLAMSSEWDDVRQASINICHNNNDDEITINRKTTTTIITKVQRSIEVIPINAITAVVYQTCFPEFF